MLNYTKEVMQHFTNPKNVGKIENADGIGKVGNLSCGDVMWVYIKVENDVIKDIKFKTFGCVSAIATSSMITELAKGKTIKEALTIDKQKVMEELGGLPQIKVHCSLLAVDALFEAIYNYLEKNNLEISEENQKKHEKIKYSSCKTEEKYKDWTDKQKEVEKNG
jgi:nitrogen fixation NifU-like protein